MLYTSYCLCNISRNCQQTPSKVSAQLDVGHRATINHLFCWWVRALRDLWHSGYGLVAWYSTWLCLVLYQPLDHTPHAINLVMHSSPTLSNTYNKTRRGIRDLDHLGNQYSRPCATHSGCLTRWSKSSIPGPSISSYNLYTCIYEWHNFCE